jgi:hypothetical protein
MSRNAGRRRGGPERGSAALEAAIGLPAFLLFVGLIIFAGRVAIATQAVDSAATQAARTASIARTATDAGATARSAATSSLTSQQVNCVTPQSGRRVRAPVTPRHRHRDRALRGQPGHLAVPGVPAPHQPHCVTRDTFRGANDPTANGRHGRQVTPSTPAHADQAAHTGGQLAAVAVRGETTHPPGAAIY